MVGKAFLCDLRKNDITIPMGIRRAIWMKKWKITYAVGVTAKVHLTGMVRCTPVVGAGVKDNA